MIYVYIFPPAEADPVALSWFSWWESHDIWIY